MLLLLLPIIPLPFLSFSPLQGVLLLLPLLPLPCLSYSPLQLASLFLHDDTLVKVLTEVTNPGRVLVRVGRNRHQDLIFPNRLSPCQARRPCSTWQQLEAEGSLAPQLLLLSQSQPRGTGWGTLSRSSPSSTGAWPG